MRTANATNPQQQHLAESSPSASKLPGFLPREEMFGKKQCNGYILRAIWAIDDWWGLHALQRPRSSKQNVLAPRNDMHKIAHGSSWIMDRVVPSDCIQESLGCSARSGHRGFQLIYKLLSVIGATNTCHNAIRMCGTSCHLSTWFVSLVIEGTGLSNGKTFILLCFNFPRRGQHSTLRSTRRMPGSLNQP